MTYPSATDGTHKFAAHQFLFVLIFTAPDDFQSVSVQRTFTPLSGTTRCVNIPIKQDEVVEGEERFLVFLSSSSSELTIQTPVAVVVIQDGADSK